MKPFRLMFMAALVGITGLLMLAPIAGGSVSVGSAVPDITLVDTHGNQRALKDFSDEIVVLEWSNHECPFVGKHYGSGNMQSLQKTYTDKGVVWLTILSSAPGKQGHVDADQANVLTKSRGAHPSAVLLDPAGRAGRAFRARTTPHMYIIDHGTLVYMGGIDSIASADKADINTAVNYVAVGLDEVLGGKAVSTSQTRPYGCTIKY